MGYKYFLVLSSHPEMGIFSILAKISGNIEIEIFPYCTILPEN